MSKSNIEELIGLLWLILTVMLYQNGIKHWWIVTLVLGLLCQVAAIVYAWMAVLKIVIAKQKLLERQGEV